jgi:hypothetical protein
MRPLHRTSRWGQLAGLTFGAGALVFTFACNSTPNAQFDAVQPQAATQPGAPVVVSCEPHQRTIVRPVVMNGAAVSQIECVAAAGIAPIAAPQPAGYTPASYAPPAAAPRRVVEPVYRDVPDARVVPVSNGSAGPVRASQVVYDERPVKQTRSVKKSAVIIGSSAGAGAGVGAAMGGKKGALIGAAIGGGGAAIWDQITRRK